MWPFHRRRRPAPVDVVRVGEQQADPAAYDVFTTSEHRHPEVFASLWLAASTTERDQGRVKRWATLVPVPDPAFGVADMTVLLDGRTACYLRPPHLGRVARRLDEANAASMEVPALIEWGPAGPTVRLIIDLPA